MQAWHITRPGPILSGPMELTQTQIPVPAAGEVRLKVSACGVCRTDLHLAEGDLPVHRHAVVPGHEVVGVVDQLGEGSNRFALGDRVGVAWLRHTCGVCRFCLRGDENLCLSPQFTGWDADGGYAEHTVVPEDYAYRLPGAFDDEHAAPLLCAGIIGYRALRGCRLPAGGSLGIYGFGGSAHLCAQVAIWEGAKVHVFTRSREARRLSLELGAVFAGEPADAPPRPLDSAIIFAPAGELVAVALQGLDRGGTLAIAGIHMSRIAGLDYQEHLFYERRLTSITASTRKDAEQFLDIAGRIGIKVTVQPFALDEAAHALSALAQGRIRGAGVLLTGRGT